MGDLQTVKIKQKHGEGDSAGDYAIINQSDFDPKVHHLYEGTKADLEDGRSELEQQIAEEHEAKRRFDANRGLTGGTVSPVAINRNPSGTYSEPTPTDIRYPDKNATEFENNHGGFVGRSAAQLRQAAGLPDAPGGLKPQVEIPADWQGMSIGERRAIVTKLGGEEGMKSADANAFIQKEFDRREQLAKTAAQPQPAPGEPAPTPLEVTTAANVEAAKKA